MSLATSKIGSAVSQLGGGLAFLRECQSDGTALVAPDIFHQLPYIKESSIEDVTAKKEYETEDGSMLYADGSRKVSFILTLLQRDVNTLSAAVGEMRGKFYNYLHQKSITTVNGLYQYLYAPIVQVVSELKYKTQGNEVQMTLFCTKVGSTVTNSSWSGVSGTLSTTFPTGASITVTPDVHNSTNEGGYYTWYTTAS